MAPARPGRAGRSTDFGSRTPPTGDAPEDSAGVALSATRKRAAAPPPDALAACMPMQQLPRRHGRLGRQASGDGRLEMLHPGLGRAVAGLVQHPDRFAALAAGSAPLDGG